MTDSPDKVPSERPLALRQWAVALLAILALTTLGHLSALWGYFHADDWLNIRWMQPPHRLVNVFFGNWQFGEHLINTDQMAFVPNYLYRPIPRVSMLFDRWIWGIDHPVGFHLTNVLLHGLNAFFLWGIAWTLFRRRFVASGVAALFMFHPLTVEPTHWISARTDLWVATFSFAAVWLTLAWSRVGEFEFRRFLTLPLLVLALMSKETAIVLPGMLLGIDLWRQRGGGAARVTWWVLTIAVLAWYFIQRKLMFDTFTGHGLGHPNPFYPLVTMVKFMIICVAPWDGRLWPSVVGVFILYGMNQFITLRGGRRAIPMGLFGLLWITLAFIPLMAIDYRIDLNNLRANTRLLYPALAGMSLLAGVTLCHLSRKAMILAVLLAVIWMIPSTSRAMLGWHRASVSAEHTLELILTDLTDDRPEGIVWIEGFPERESLDRAYLFRDVDFGEALMLVADERALDLPRMANGPMFIADASSPELFRHWGTEEPFAPVATLLTFVEMQKPFQWRLERQDASEETRTIDFITP